MTQRNEEAEKPQITVGVLGAEGAGKTTLTQAILRYLSCRNENVVQGDEIDAGSLLSCKEEEQVPHRYETTSRRYLHLDWRRHADTMQYLAVKPDLLHGALLVVSALDGVTAQTRQQIGPAVMAGAVDLVVCITHCDLADDPELLEVVELEVQELVEEYGYSAETPILRGNALAALNASDDTSPAAENGLIANLLDALDSTIQLPPRLEDLPFLMTVEDVFSITGRGTIACGRVERGQIRSSETVEIVGIGPTRTAVAAELEQFHQSQPRIVGGDNAGLLLRDVPRPEVQRGQVLAAPGTIHAHTRFGALLYLPYRHARDSDSLDLSTQNFAFFLRGVEIPGNLQWYRGSGSLPRAGDSLGITVTLEAAVAIEPGQRFLLRQEGRTCGIGIVTLPLPQPQGP